MKVATTERQAGDLLDLLVDDGPLTSEDCRQALGWSKGRFGQAVRFAREVLCPELGMAIPHPIPPDWTYEVTTDWEPVEAGASYSMGMVEARLSAIHRDVGIVLPHLERGTKDWRRANFLQKHLGHLTATLTEIHDG